MAAKFVVASVGIFMAKIKKEILRESPTKPLVCKKKYITDVLSLWNTIRDKAKSFISKANDFYSIIKFTAEVFQSKITFLDAKLHKGVTLTRESILDAQINFEYTNFYSCQPP